MTLSTKLGEARGWRSDLRANGVPRRPEPDRSHVEGARQQVLVTADKPPAVLVQPPEPKALPPAPAPGRRRPFRQFYTPEFQAQIVADFHETRRREPHLKQKEYCKRIGINSTTLSNWTANADAVRVEARAQIVADFHAARAREPHLLQRDYCARIGLLPGTLSDWIGADAAARAVAAARAAADPPARPDPPAPAPAPAPPPEPSRRRRSWETVSRELAAAGLALSRANDVVDGLKEEMREILDAE